MGKKESIVGQYFKTKEADSSRATCLIRHDDRKKYPDHPLHHTHTHTVGFHLQAKAIHAAIWKQKKENTDIYCVYTVESPKLWIRHIPSFHGRETIAHSSWTHPGHFDMVESASRIKAILFSLSQPAALAEKAGKRRSPCDSHTAVAKSQTL